MASYVKPVRDYAIFDSLAFQVEETAALTTSNGNKTLLKYPNAQDNEIFQSVTISSETLNMNNNNITNMDNISSNLTNKTSNIAIQERIYQEIDFVRPSMDIISI